mgnify:CR=1 FL=1
MYTMLTSVAKEISSSNLIHHQQQEFGVWLSGGGVELLKFLSQ